ncbi:hypothetical protein Leryth_005424 [Lithospermum erythrorhizon]|nr:hypothetical protein Leryth_005424 [Lithospermum erythrorhizon]
MPHNSIVPKPETRGTGSMAGQLHLSDPSATPNLAYPINSNADTFLQMTISPVTLKFEDIVYKIKLEKNGSSWGRPSRTKEKTILNGLTGMVCPGEILAMLGPSGSGKTTLLTALGGRLSGKLSGKITYNGKPFSGSIKRRTGFVAQDDVLYPHLTVYETLMFTALLRLPQSLSKEDKERHVEHIIAELGLTKCRNSMIGGPLFRGISGGEKKRVSIGQEMLINPSLLLLDEPTSGLDSTTAQRIITTLKRLASGGCTVVTTIHQPSSRLYHMFDKVVVLSEGQPNLLLVLHPLPEYFSSIGFSTSLTINSLTSCWILPREFPDPNTIEQGESTGKEQKTVREVLISAYDKNISKKLKSELCLLDKDSNNHMNNASMKRDVKSEQWCTSWCYQFKVLLLRGLKERRHESFNKLRIFQVITVAILGGLLWWRTPTSHIGDRVSMLFFSVLGLLTHCTMQFSLFLKKGE